jgi:hypothetical protein
MSIRLIHLLILSATLLPLTGLTGCGRSGPTPATPSFHPTTLASTTNLGKTLLVTDKAPAKYHPIHYEYIMPEEQQRQVLREAPTLNVGDAVDDIVTKLGPPLNDKLLYPKESSRPPSREMVYYFARRELNGANVYDPHIAIFFDQSEKIRSIASNVPGIPSLNWPVSQVWEEPPASRVTTSTKPQ